jgi:scyllo-inositol 2-dehydrogenase (NADP+)
MSKIKGAIIGFGRMGVTHCSILRCHPGVQIIGIVEPAKLMRSAVEKYLNIPAFPDLGSLFKHAKPDFVIVATPTKFHAQQVEFAVEQGCHVFVEKPYVLSSIDGRRIMASAEQRGLVNQVGYVNRYNDVFAYFKSLLSSERFSNIAAFEVDIRSPTVVKPVKGGWRDSPDVGGGCLFEMGSHGLDLICHLFGVPADVARAELARVYSSAAEDVVGAEFIYSNGLTGKLCVNWSDITIRKPMYTLRAYGEDWSITADHHEIRIDMSSPPFLDDATEGKLVRYATDLVKPVRFYLRGYEFTRQLDCFVEAVAGAREVNLCTFRDAIEANVLIEKIRQRAAEGAAGTSVGPALVAV